MNSRSLSLASLALSLLLPAVLSAQVGGTASVRLRGYDEVPAINSGAGGRFDATISDDGTEITYTLSYQLISPSQSHIHFAQKGVNGGISVFLCTNLGNGPQGTQTCPAGPATLHGTIQSDDVIGSAAGQGIAAGNLSALLRAIRAGIAYVNVHSAKYPGGEVRGQLVFTPAD
jgi:hypothetical protein